MLEVAPELLGCTISHAGVTVRLTEVEAYDGANDPGSHAFRGQTPRTQVMSEGFTPYSSSRIARAAPRVPCNKERATVGARESACAVR